MIEPQLLPGIKEATERFWTQINAIQPPVVKAESYVHGEVSTALFLALAEFRRQIAPGTMETEYKAAADQAYDLYDHGDMKITAAGDWQVFDFRWMRIVMVEGAMTPKGPPLPRPIVFVVEFDLNSTEVKDAYYESDPN